MLHEIALVIFGFIVSVLLGISLTMTVIKSNSILLIGDNWVCNKTALINTEASCISYVRKESLIYHFSGVNHVI